MKKALNVLLIAGLSLSLAGCATGMLGGNSGTRFNATVQKIYDASIAELQDENMPVVSKTLTKDKAVITSEYPNGTSVHIVANATSLQYSEVRVRVGSLGDDYRAYDLMKKIEARIK
ncbi:MAG: DUF3568 family protein [Candidatus Omnitrophica bacterium]|nr:DUF3568 family protein [Candidatus Omnitrophota bacterium]